MRKLLLGTVIGAFVSGMAMAGPPDNDGTSQAGDASANAADKGAVDHSGAESGSAFGAGAAGLSQSGAMGGHASDGAAGGRGGSSSTPRTEDASEESCSWSRQGPCRAPPTSRRSNERLPD